MDDIKKIYIKFGFMIRQGCNDPCKALTLRLDVSGEGDGCVSSRVRPDIQLVSCYPAILPVFKVSGYPTG